MQIRLNGLEHDLPPGTTLGALLVAEGLADRRVAVEINGEIVPRSCHDAHQICDKDRIEIVHALGGG